MGSAIDYQPHIEELSRLLNEGHQGQARKKFLALNFKRIPRNLALPFADMARRMNMPKITLKILKPIVRAETTINPLPTDQEKALYATALSRLGVFDETLTLLKNINNDTAPESLLFQAAVFMLQWDYEAAIPLLRKYISVPTLSVYDRLVAQVNLASALIWNGQNSAGDLLLKEVWSEIGKQPQLKSFKIIHGYSVELAAESKILASEWSKAQWFTLHGQRLLTGTHSRYEFYAKKWKAVLILLWKPEDPAALASLHFIKSEAFKLSEWEIARDCDFFEALAFRNDELFIKVFLGTPFPKFRERILRIYKPQFEIPDSILWRLGPQKTEGPTFDIEEFGAGTKSALIRTPILYSLFQILTRDFYKPVALGTVASELYPGEHYNPNSSPLKIQQVIKRLRQWFKENSIPLDVELKKEHLALVSDVACALKINRVTSQISKEKFLMLQLKKKYGKDMFTSHEAATVLGLSPRTIQRLLIQALELKWLVRDGAGPSTRYQVKL